MLIVVTTRIVFVMQLTSVLFCEKNSSPSPAISPKRNNISNNFDLEIGGMFVKAKRFSVLADDFVEKE